MRPVRQGGYSLVELVVTLLIMGILAFAVTGFITYGTRIYVDSQDWQQSLGNVRFAAQRLTRELQDAIPGTVSVDEQCIRFEPLAWSERYLAAPQPGGGNRHRVLAYAPGCCAGNDCSPCEANDFLLADSYQVLHRRGIAGSQCLGSGCARVRFELDGDLPTGPFATGQRYFLSAGPVAWCRQANGDLVRNDGSGDVLMGEGLLTAPGNGVCDLSALSDPDCPFVSQPAVLQRNNLVRLQWWLENDGIQQLFVQEVQLENVP